MKQISIRLDDITPDMNWENFWEVKKIFDKHNIKPLLGVVPDNQDQLLNYNQPKLDFYEIIRGLQEEGYIVAQHGYSHIYTTTDSGLLRLNPFSEFAGEPYQIQYDKLRQGKEILEREGIHTNIFMPPGHTYDEITLNALKELHFKYVTDGFYHRPYIKSGLTFFPCTMLESYKGKKYDTLCFHLNHKDKNDLRKLDDFIQNNRDKIIDFNPLKMELLAKKQNFFRALGEMNDIAIWKTKRGLGANQILSEYMESINSKNKAIKWLKRLFFSPILLMRMIRKK